MLNLAKFKNLIQLFVQNQTIGSAFSIFSGMAPVKAGHTGNAVLNAFGNPLPFSSVPQSPSKRMACMSTSKTITAAAAIKAMLMLFDKGVKVSGVPVSFNSPISAFLPSPAVWPRGPNVTKLRLVDLLTMQSGLLPVGDFLDQDLYQNLRTSIFNGAIGPLVYQNINYSLFRIIIPYMISPPGFWAPFESLQGFDSLLASAYVKFVQKEILEPCNIQNGNVVPVGEPFTTYYNFHSPFFNHFADDPASDGALLRCGAGWWNLSALEYGSFIAALRLGVPDPISPAMPPGPRIWGAMVANQMGVTTLSGATGTYVQFDGSYTDPQSGAGGQVGWVAFPNNITAVLMINSQGGFKHPVLVPPAPGAPISLDIFTGTASTTILTNAHNLANT
ncbi:MAG: serine hydrolase [Byssovorax sp.]